MPTNIDGFSEPVLTAAKWLLPKPWQRFMVTLGLPLAIYGFSVHSKVVVAIGLGAILVPFLSRLVRRAWLYLFGRSRRYADELSRAADGPILYSVTSLTEEDELASLVVSDAGLPDWWIEYPNSDESVRQRRLDDSRQVRIEWVRRVLRVSNAAFIDQVEHDVGKLVREENEFRWSRLAGIIPNQVFDRWIYVVHPSFGNRWMNRSAHVTIMKVGSWNPMRFSYWRSSSNPAQYHGSYEFGVDVQLPNSVERKLHTILAEAGFEIGPIDDYTRAAKRWQRLYRGKIDVVIEPQIFSDGRFEGTEPTLSIGNNSYYLGFREWPIVERLPDGRLSILFLPSTFAKLTEENGKLHIDLGVEEWLFDPGTRRLERIRDPEPTEGSFDYGRFLSPKMLEHLNRIRRTKGMSDL